MYTLPTFVAAFTEQHRFKGAPFHDPQYLFVFADIYAADLPTCPNPIRDPSWPTVTCEEIEAACVVAPGLSAFLCAYIGHTQPLESSSSFLPPPPWRPNFRSLALGGDGYNYVRSLANVALIGVDIQNDFILKTGSLSVPDAEAAIPAMNRLFAREWAATILTADWHPHKHCSFAVNNPGSTLFKPFTLPNGLTQIAWPVHCVQGSTGAEFHSGLVLPANYEVVYKGMDNGHEAYSGFAGFYTDGTTLEARLRAANIGAVVICGVATDYCVAATAKDAARLGFAVTVVLSACRGVAKETTQQALAAMGEEGIDFLKDY